MTGSESMGVFQKLFFGKMEQFAIMVLESAGAGWLCGGFVEAMGDSFVTAAGSSVRDGSVVLCPHAMEINKKMIPIPKTFLFIVRNDLLKCFQ